MSLDSELSAGFQVKYLGSVSFTRKKRQPLKGIVSLQRPLLDLYTRARRRGESHRSIHPLALTQQLEVCDYGLVVAEGTSRGETVVTKVITPLSNVVLWASVRFHARIIKKRVFGAAFVPLACSDGVLDHKSYICLASKQRFLVSLTHPSVFACIYRSVSSPTTFECHAFVCATAEDALAVAAFATAAGRQGDSGGRMMYVEMPRRRIAASLDSGGTDYYSPSDKDEDRMYEYRESVITRTDTEEESNSYASVVNKASSPLIGRRRFVLGANSPRHMGRPQKRFMHHREARALIGKFREPARPLPPEDVRWEANPQRRKEQLPHDDHQRSTSSYERDDPVPSDDSPQEPPPPRFRNSSTMTDPAKEGGEQAVPSSHPPTTEVLTETIDLSSETASSLESSSVGGGGWKPVLPATKKGSSKEQQQPPPPLVKYTYFGYETYARPTSERQVTGIAQRIAADKRSDGSMGEQQRRSKGRATNKGGVIQGNGTSKVTINVPYRPSSRTSSASSRTVPHGVRSFHKSGHVRNWSSLSQTSAGSSASSSTYRGPNTLPPPRPPAAHNTKIIRWSSEDRLPRRQGGGGFFWSLKRIGMQSLTKAKHKTGKFISSVKTKLMGPKRSSADGSEDSAYDTSEVCLSPSGRQGSSSPSRQPAPSKSAGARRQQSWSFHDLRTAAVERPTVRSRGHNHRRKHRRRRKAGRSSSSSDSGVEAAYHSDNSARKTGSDHGRSGVTRVKVQHGMGTDTFQRWSHTNIQDELGYIP